MGNIGIAYLNTHGKGFDHTTPFVTVFQADATKAQVEAEINRLKEKGCKQITPFRYEKEFSAPPKTVDELVVHWWQVNKNKFDLANM